MEEEENLKQTKIEIIQGKAFQSYFAYGRKLGEAFSSSKPPTNLSNITV